MERQDGWVPSYKKSVFQEARLGLIPLVEEAFDATNDRLFYCHLVRTPSASTRGYRRTAAVLPITAWRNSAAVLTETAVGARLFFLGDDRLLVDSN
jgi:hypothetical protein